MKPDQHLSHGWPWPESGTGVHALSRIALWAVLICFLALWFHALGARTLIPTDEARYAEIAREMAVSGDFITPRLNGIKYYGKPPLQAWMTAISFRLFGFGEWQARLWTGLCGLLGIAMVGCTGRSLFGERVGLMAALVLASSLYWALAGHIASYDMSLSAMMTVALCALLRAQLAGTSAAARRNWMMLCWAGMALAVLSKGLVGVVLPGAVLVAYTLATRDWGLWKRLHFGIGMALFCVLAGPWFIAASIRSPEFPEFFFYREHVLRYTTDVHARGEPWHYFLPLLMTGILPWLAVLPQSLWQAWRVPPAQAASAAPVAFRPALLLLIWAVLIFVFFSFSHAKLPSYIVPVFPALALLIACHLERASHKAVVAVAGLFGACCAVVIALLPWVLAAQEDANRLVLYQAYSRWILAASVLGLAGSFVAAWIARQHKFRAVVVLAAAGFVGGQLILIGHEPIGREMGGVAHVAAIEAELEPGTPLYAVGAYEYALPFYLRRTVTLVAYAADGMMLGLEQEPERWIPELGSFVARWNADAAAGRRALAILTPAIYATLETQGVPLRIIARDSRRVVVANDVPVGSRAPQIRR